MNHLVIMSDEYMAGALSCAGHPVVRTPNLDRLAGRGVRFEHAYTPSPMCVPARGAFQAGLRVDQVGCWSSAEPYHGSPPSWGTTLRERGVSVASVGKLHFRSSDDDNGFAPEMLPLHVAEGVGWLPGLLRRNPPPFDSSGFAGSAGEGESAYSDYDRRICERAVDWLRHAPDTPWVLFVSFVCPHYPLRCPPAFFPDPETVDMPLCYAASERPAHPVVRALMEASGYDRHFTGERQVRLARAAYYGLCAYVDDLVGRLLGALEGTGQDRDTRIVFTADHGEMLGNHGAWTKMLMYEDSVSVPMLLAGPDLPRGEVNPTPVTLLDVPGDAAPRPRLRAAAGGGRGVAGRIVPAPAARSRRAEPVPRRLVDHRLLHAALGPLEVHPLRRATSRSCSTLRATPGSARTWPPAGRIGTWCGPGGGSCGRSSTRRRSTAARSPTSGR